MAYRKINGDTYQVVALVDPVTGEMTSPAGAGGGGTYSSPTLAAVAALGTGAELVVAAFTRISLQVQNTGVNALNGFEVSTRGHASALWIPRLNAAGHFTAPPSGSILRACSSSTGAAVDPTTLAAGGNVEFNFDFRDFFVQAIRVRATSAAGTALQFYLGGD